MPLELRLALFQRRSNLQFCHLTIGTTAKHLNIISSLRLSLYSNLYIIKKIKPNITSDDITLLKYLSFSYIVVMIRINWLPHNIISSFFILLICSLNSIVLNIYFHITLSWLSDCLLLGKTWNVVKDVKQKIILSLI